MQAELFMSIAASRGPKEQSFEEVRVEDYLKAYIETGKSPAPCPQSPTGERERIALGLPPLFQPQSVLPTVTPSYSTPSNSGTNKDSSQVQRELSSLPKVQEFRTTLGSRLDGYERFEMFQSISAHDDFQHFSFEELRHQAYLTGMKYSSLKESQFDPQEFFQSISSTQPFLQHSHEELRFAYLKARRELTSQEIFDLQLVPAR